MVFVLKVCWSLYRIALPLSLQAKFGYRDYDRRWGEDNFPASLAWREDDGVQQRILIGDLSLNYVHAGGQGMLTAGVDMQEADYRTYADKAAGRSVDNDIKARSTGFLSRKNSCWATGSCGPEGAIT